MPQISTASLTGPLMAMWLPHRDRTSRPWPGSSLPGNKFCRNDELRMVTSAPVSRVIGTRIRSTITGIGGDLAKATSLPKWIQLGMSLSSNMHSELSRKLTTGKLRPTDRHKSHLVGLRARKTLAGGVRSPWFGPRCQFDGGLTVTSK